MSTRIAVTMAVAGLAALPALAGPTLASPFDPNAQVATSLLGGQRLLGPSPELDHALTNLRQQLSGGSGGLTDDPPIPAAHQNSQQSMSLRLFGVGGAQGFANSLGEVTVQINTGFQNLGTNGAGRQILGQMRQFIDPNDINYIEAEFKTVDGSALVPVNTTVGGQAVVAFGWEVGATDPIDWQALWSSVNVPANGAVATFFGPGGTSGLNHTPELVGVNGGPWNGVDANNPAILLGDLFNRVLIRYQVQPVPAPAGLGTLVAALGFAARRRRR